MDLRKAFDFEWLEAMARSVGPSGSGYLNGQTDGVDAEWLLRVGSPCSDAANPEDLNSMVEELCGKEQTPATFFRDFFEKMSTSKATFNTYLCVEHGSLHMDNVLLGKDGSHWIVWSDKLRRDGHLLADLGTWFIPVPSVG